MYTHIEHHRSRMWKIHIIACPHHNIIGYIDALTLLYLDQRMAQLHYLQEIFIIMDLDDRRSEIMIRLCHFGRTDRHIQIGDITDNAFKQQRIAAFISLLKLYVTLFGQGNDLCTIAHDLIGEFICQCRGDFDTVGQFFDIEK